MNKIKNFEQFNEGLIDKMTPKSDAEIDMKFKELFKELVDIGMTEGYTSDQDIIESFFEKEWENIVTMAEDGWSTNDIYSELQMDLEYWCSDDDEDEYYDEYDTYYQPF
jgi:hypothetical protein